MTEFDDLEQALVARIEPIPNRAAQEAWTSDRTWTKILLLELTKLGHEQKFYVSAGAAAASMAKVSGSTTWCGLKTRIATSGTLPSS